MSNFTEISPCELLRRAFNAANIPQSSRIHVLVNWLANNLENTQIFPCITSLLSKLIPPGKGQSMRVAETMDQPNQANSGSVLVPKAGRVLVPIADSSVGEDDVMLSQGEVVSFIFGISLFSIVCLTGGDMRAETWTREASPSLLQSMIAILQPALLGTGLARPQKKIVEFYRDDGNSL